ncbi:MAG: dipeptide epimerase [Anaerolineales bacterium]|nr:dipeptide epimerase [Anaerolineales bacterium]
MKLTPEPATLQLRTTFRIAHGASDQRHNVLAHLDEGVGEGAAVPYHGETQAGLLADLARAAASLETADPLRIDDCLAGLPPLTPAARAAVDIALHDVWGQRLGQPLYRLFGLNPAAAPETSFTIAIDEPEAMAARARDSGWPILKIKVGTEADEARLRAIRAATPARLRVDANAGWTREQAAHLIPRLAEFGLELVEQPLPREDREGLRWLKAQNLGLPIFADESVKTARDVAALAGAVDGVVIKLMKTGGLREALRAIHTARALGLQVMLSCMVESSVGVTAAAHLAPLCDLVDLDGPLLIANDPYAGVRYEGARLILPDRPGLGVLRR